VPKLTIAAGEEQWVYEIFGDEPDVTLGRGAANSVQLHDGTASKHHASIRLIEGHWKLVDIESRNGVRVNGRYKNQHWLVDGDTIHIGDVMLHYATDGAPSGPPESMRAAAPAAPAVSGSLPMTPVAIGATPARTPVPAAPASPTAATLPARPARGRSERRMREDDDEGEERRPRRRSNQSSPALMVLMGLGAIAFLALMFALLSGGKDINQSVRVKAGKLAADYKLKEAVAYAEANGDPTAAFWDELELDIRKWKRQIAMQPNVQRNKEAATWFEMNIERQANTEDRSGPQSKGALSPSEIAALLRQFLETYGDTSKARQLVAREPTLRHYKEYQEWMLANASSDADPVSIVRAVETQVDDAVARHQYGDAVKILESLKARQRLLIIPDKAEEVRRLANDKIATIMRQARSAFDELMRKVDNFAANDENRRAKRLLQDVVDTWGLPNLISEAEVRMGEL
jgi:hypothetical protein